MLKSLVTTSIGKKQLMAITGLLLAGFLVTHLLGNLLLLVGSDEFNLYAYRLTSTPLIYVAEAGLIGIFLLHLGLALAVNIENKRARPQPYYLKRKMGGGANIFSRTMPLSGLVILAFIIGHLLNFKFGTYYSTEVDGVVMRDLYRLVIEYFSHPIYTAWYCIAMFVMTFHLIHGLQSSFQTLGIHSPLVNDLVKKGGAAFAIVIPAGFAGLAIWCCLQS